VRGKILAERRATVDAFWERIQQEPFGPLDFEADKHWPPCDIDRRDREDWWARGVIEGSLNVGPPASFGFSAGIEVNLAPWLRPGRRDAAADEAHAIEPALQVDDVVVKPNPSGDGAIFTFEGSGVPDTITVEIYDLAGNPVWSDTKANVTEIEWDGTDEAGLPLPNGAYVYVMTLTGADDPIAPFKDKVFISR